MKKVNPLNYILFRTLSHSTSNKKIISRTKEDNKELHEVSSETFTNRKGAHPIDAWDDVAPSLADKKPIKPAKGMRKFKGAKSIRKENEEDRLVEELKSYDKYLEKEEGDYGRDAAED